MQPVGAVRRLVEVIDADRRFEAKTRILSKRAQLVGRVDQVTPFGVDTIDVAVDLAVQFVSVAQNAQADRVFSLPQRDARSPAEVVVIKLVLGAVAVAVDVRSGVKTKRRIHLVVDFAAERESQIIVGGLNAGRVQRKNQVAQSRDRYLAFAGGEIDIAIVAHAGFNIRSEERRVGK